MARASPRCAASPLPGLGIGRVAGIPYLVLISIAVAIVLGIVIALTRFGRYQANC